MQERAFVRVWVLGFLIVEAAALAGFWAWMFLRPSAAGLFVSGREPIAVLRLFAGGDLLVYLASGVACVLAVARRSGWAGRLLWLHAGASVYAAACTAWGIAEGTFTVWAVLAMLPAAAGSVTAAVLSGRTGVGT